MGLEDVRDEHREILRGLTDEGIERAKSLFDESAHESVPEADRRRVETYMRAAAARQLDAHSSLELSDDDERRILKPVNIHTTWRHVLQAHARRREDHLAAEAASRYLRRARPAEVSSWILDDEASTADSQTDPVGAEEEALILNDSTVTRFVALSVLADRIADDGYRDPRDPSGRDPVGGRYL